MKLKMLAGLTAALVAIPAVTSASPVKWTLDGHLSLNSGAETAAGTFTYDADTGAFSNVALSTSTGHAYTQFGGASSGSGNAEFITFLMSDYQSGVDTIALRLLNISLAKLTDSGGVLHINTDATTQNMAEYLCNTDCVNSWAVGVDYWVTNGVSTLTGVPLTSVPEPGGLALFGLALAGLVATRRAAS